MQQKPIKLLVVHAGNIVISKLIQTKNNSKYLNGYLWEVRRPLVLILPKICGYVKTSKDRNNKLMYLLIHQ